MTIWPNEDCARMRDEEVVRVAAAFAQGSVVNLLLLDGTRAHQVVAVAGSARDRLRCACRKPKPEHIDDAVRPRLTVPLWFRPAARRKSGASLSSERCVLTSS